jgi:hypothetical protein
VGQPVEDVISINHLVFGGTLDRHPDLKVIVAGSARSVWTRP